MAHTPEKALDLTRRVASRLADEYEEEIDAAMGVSYDGGTFLFPVLYKPERVTQYVLEELRARYKDWTVNWEDFHNRLTFKPNET